MGYNFLVLIDAYTKWPVVHIMKNITAKETIIKCREIFATFGLPRVLVSDNGTTFTSLEFQNFLRENGIIHKRTALYHPATNGLAERFVQTLKQALRKLYCDGENIQTMLQRALFNYRLMSHSETMKIPAEAMFGRNLRSRLDLILPKKVFKTEANETMGTNRMYKVGDRVACREYLNKNCKWRFGTVSKKLGSLHYLVNLENGKVWKRHINQMRTIGTTIIRDNSFNLDYDTTQSNNISIKDETLNTFVPTTRETERDISALETIENESLEAGDHDDSKDVKPTEAGETKSANGKRPT